jgi:hypothetical protein
MHFLEIKRISSSISYSQVKTLCEFALQDLILYLRFAPQQSGAILFWSHSDTVAV